MITNYSNRVALFTLCRLEVRRFLRIWPQTILPSLISLVLYMLIFGTVIGSQIKTMGGIRYIEYVLPGLVLMPVVNNSYVNVASSFFGNKFQRSIEELLVSSASNWTILCGYVFGGVARGLLTGVLTLLVGLMFIPIKIFNWPLALITILLTSIIFALTGFINAIYANKFDDVSIIPTFVLSPMTYLGGVFYSTDILPEIWQKISHFNPILYQVSTFRYSLIGAGSIDGSTSFIMPSLLIMLGCIAVLTAISMHFLNTGKGLKS
jgi:ABC-2 type transport system permease protein